MKKIAIIGAGISGLFIANLFKKNPNYQINIFEKNTSITCREGYGLQLSVNSIKLLNQIGFKNLKKNNKSNPKKIDFYSMSSSKKICELNISEFNSMDCKYTTLKRSTLINFLKKGLDDNIKTDYDIKNIDLQNNEIKLSFENSKDIKCDYLIISDGVFSKSKNLLSHNKLKPKYNNSLAIRGVISKNRNNINNENISLFLGSNFHQVIYPVGVDEDLNYIAVLKYKLSGKDLKNYSLFKDHSFIKKVKDKFPTNCEILKNLKDIEIYPIFVSNNFYKPQNKNIYFIGDAFFAFPPPFAQGASQSIEGAYELFNCFKNENRDNFFSGRLKKTKMINKRSRLNQFAFQISNPISVFFRNILLKRSVKSKKFLENYLGKIYR